MKKNNREATAAVEGKQFESESLGLLRQLREEQAATSLVLENLQGQTAFIRQQLMQMAVLGGQFNQLLQNQMALQGELQKFQTGGSQRAMAAVFHKLFRDLIVVMNQLDELAAPLSTGKANETSLAWSQSVGIVRDQLERLLGEWGCTEARVQPGDEFDPEIHEAVQGAGSPETAPQNRITRVVRRGWKLHDTILQFPRVVVH